jgi:hypothetical protein
LVKKKKVEDPLFPGKNDRQILVHRCFNGFAFFAGRTRTFSDSTLRFPWSRTASITPRVIFFASACAKLSVWKHSLKYQNKHDQDALIKSHIWLPSQPAGIHVASWFVCTSPNHRRCWPSHARSIWQPYIVMPMCPSKFILLFKINIINTRLNTSNIECFRQRCNSCSNLVNSVDTSNLLLNPSYTVHIKFFRFGFGTFNEVPPNSNMTLNIILFQNGNRIYIQCLHS